MRTTFSGLRAEGMPSVVTPIALHYVFSVNCYVVETNSTHVLIDTGPSARRADLERRLAEAGCGPHSLRLIVLTHAHADHAGNCAYLREKYGCPIAMHAGDAGQAQRGDMFWNPKRKRTSASAVVRTVLSASRLGRFDAFEPDVLLSDGQDLGEYGLDAHVIHFPGHSPGSVGVLTAAGDLFCGDLLTNTGRPARNSIVDDAADMDASVCRLSGLGIRTVYPGHGGEFPIEQLMRSPGMAG